MYKNLKRRDSKAAPDEIMDLARRAAATDSIRRSSVPSLDLKKNNKALSSPPPYGSVEENSNVEGIGGKAVENSAPATPSKDGRGDSVSRISADGRTMARMETAIRLNEIIVEQSSTAQLVIINMPSYPTKKDDQDELHYMDYLDVLTENLNRVLMVRGSGREYVTIYS